jgi:hypothetical protein
MMMAVAVIADITYQLLAISIYCHGSKLPQFLSVDKNRKQSKYLNKY